MHRLPTALLRHESAAGLHYDWLLTDPNNVKGKLWTGRVALPSHQWQHVRSFDVESSVPHRREYLTYQGAISNSRGHVTRTDQGSIAIELWSVSRIVVQIHMQHFAGRLDLRQCSSQLWRATRLTV